MPQDEAAKFIANAAMERPLREGLHYRPFQVDLRHLVYALAGLEMTPGARRALDRFMAENPRGKHGRVIYDLKADFGIDPAELRRRFDFYFGRFPIQVE